MKYNINLTLVFSLLIGCSNNKNPNPERSIEVTEKIQVVETIEYSDLNSESSNSDKESLVFQDIRSLTEYKANIESFANSEHIDISIVENVIPINEDEYFLFYSMSYPEEHEESNLELYYKIDEMMLIYASKDLGNCLSLYSNMAEFVDGEYADYFFGVMNIIVEKNKLKFCKIYTDLSSQSKIRLKNEYENSCP